MANDLVWNIRNQRQILNQRDEMPEEYRPQCGDGAHGSAVYLEEIIEFLKPKGRVLRQAI